ncbi:hypothetical protein CRUP_030627, partial [Coryphaenoides rupestris]
GLPGAGAGEDDSAPDNTFEVTLTKGAKGLGFSFIMCDVDPRARALGSVVRVKQLFPQQPAHQNGRIREGDVILAIDGQRLKDLIYPRVLQLFKNSSSEVQLSLCRPAPETWSQTEPRPESVRVDLPGETACGVLVYKKIK